MYDVDIMMVSQAAAYVRKIHPCHYSVRSRMQTVATDIMLAESLCRNVCTT